MSSTSTAPVIGGAEAGTVAGVLGLLEGAVRYLPDASPHQGTPTRLSANEEEGIEHREGLDEMELRVGDRHERWEGGGGGGGGNPS